MRNFYLIAATVLACSPALMADELVTDQPAGTLRTYHGYSISHYPYMVEIVEPTDGVARDVVFGENGTDIWFKDPLTHAPTGTWIKGTIQDGIITVETPQLIDHTEDGKDWYVQRLKKTTESYTDEDGKEQTVTSWVPDTEKTSITYQMVGDDIVQVKEDDIILGMTSEGDYYYYAETDVVYTRIQGATAVKMPEGIEPETWSIIYNNDLYGTQGKVVIDGNDFYVKGFWAEQPEACIKGKIENDKVIIPSQQYLGLLKSPQAVPRFIYFMSSNLDSSGFSKVYVSSDTNLEFSYDKDNKTITPIFDKTMVPVVRYGMTPNVPDYSTLAKYQNLKFKGISKIASLPFITIPKGSSYVYNDTGWGKLEFTFRPFDSEKNALNPNLMSYSLWLDDEILVLDKEDCIYPEAYEGIDEPISEVPYMFTNGYGIKGSLSTREVMFYKIGFNEIGVQGFYNDDISGERLTTGITYINLDTQEIRYVENSAGIQDVAEDQNEIVDTVLYDLYGKRVDSSFKGIVIEKTLYSNGQFKTTKKVIR